MNIAEFFACPRCRSADLAPLDSAIRCDACGRSYPMFMGIPDFRAADIDETADFSMDEDIHVARKLSEAFDKTSTFNEMLDIFERLRELARKGQDVAGIDITRFIADHEIKPAPMRADQIAHGHDIMLKIDMHLAEIKRDMPENGVALEDGAGLGLLVDGLASRFRHLLVLDFSLCYLILVKKITQELKIENTTLICGSAEFLPVRDGLLDFVHSNNVIEHVRKQDLLISEAWRVLKPEGFLFVRSPNRFSLYFEPHFRLPGFGFFPKAIRRKINQNRQNRSIDDIALLSLSELKALLRDNFRGSVFVTFIPRRLATTASGGKIRGALVNALNSRMLGPVTDSLINSALLGTMPYHTALCFKY